MKSDLGIELTGTDVKHDDFYGEDSSEDSMFFWGEEIPQDVGLKFSFDEIAENIFIMLCIGELLY